MFHAIFVNETKDDLCVGCDILNNLHGFIKFMHHEIGRGCDIDDHTNSTGNVSLFQERRTNGLFRSDCRATITRSLTHTHQRAPSLPHDGFNIGEVNINFARFCDDVRNTLNTVEEHLVSNPERLSNWKVPVHSVNKTLIGDNNYGIGCFSEFFKSYFGGGCAALSFKVKGPCHDSNCKRAAFLCL